MESGLQGIRRLVPAEHTVRRKVALFTDSLSLLMALKTGPVRVTDGILRRIWILFFRFQCRKVQFTFQFVFSHCGVPRNEEVVQLAAKGRELPQTYPAWIVDIVMVVSPRCRNTAYQCFNAGGIPPTYRSQLLGHINPALKNLLFNRLAQSLLAQFHTGTSKYFGWLHCVLTHIEENLECRWCSPISLLHSEPSSPEVSSSSCLVTSR